MLGSLFSLRAQIDSSQRVAMLQDTSIRSVPPSFKKSRVIGVASTFVGLHLGSMAYLQYIWYKDRKRVPMRSYNDSRGYLQVDKFGHAYTAYLQSYAGVRALQWAGLSQRKAALYGGCVGFVMQLPIEIWDGMYEGWGFSWSDLGANTFGSALVMAQELAFRKQIVQMKFTFRTSPYAKQANGYLGKGFNQVMYDYNGHTYWFSLGLNHLFNHQKIPRWLNVAVGYGAGGMFGEFKNISYYKGVYIPETERYRQLLFSLDVDFTKIPTHKQWLRKVLDGMFILKVPFPAIELNTKGQVRGHWLYY
jgi:uncharacterized protein YfiM (DUF2279 family)